MNNKGSMGVRGQWACQLDINGGTFLKQIKCRRLGCQRACSLQTSGDQVG